MVEQTSKKKKLGQYFTISEVLQQFVFDNVKQKGQTLLEPSFGAGHLLKKFKQYDENYPMVCYELDNTIQPVIEFNVNQTIHYGDFTNKVITQRFQTIVGNPPYVKQKTGNLYIKFVEQCFQLLADKGELLFVVPSDFIKVTSASSLIHKMVQAGSFTHFLFPNNERLFEGANIDIMVFRYEKGVLQRDSIVNGKHMLCNENSGILTFSETEIKGSPLSSLFHVYVGLVSGRDIVYKVPIGNMEVLNDEGVIDKYIYTDTFPTTNETINVHMIANKQVLLDRKIKKFTEENWFEWGAPRNKAKIEANMGKPCIYVRNMTRNSNICFLGKVQYFGGGLLCLIPKNAMTSADIEKVLTHLNSGGFKKDYIYSGRFKIGQKQVCNIILPS